MDIEVQTQSNGVIILELTPASEEDQDALSEMRQKSHLTGYELDVDGTYLRANAAISADPAELKSEIEEFIRRGKTVLAEIYRKAAQAAAH